MESRLGRAIVSLKARMRRMSRTISARDDDQEGLRETWEAKCLTCHKSVPSHEMLGTDSFAFSDAWKTIAHR